MSRPERLATIAARYLAHLHARQEKTMTTTVQPRTYQSKTNPDVRVEAVQLTDDADWSAIAEWCGGRLVNLRDPSDEYVTVLDLGTPGDELTADEGDWVTRWPSGGCRVCRPERFAAQWEPAA